jgi:hypothetical protein
MSDRHTVVETYGGSKHADGRYLCAMCGNFSVLAWVDKEGADWFVKFNCLREKCGATDTKTYRSARRETVDKLLDRAVRDWKTRTMATAGLRKELSDARNIIIRLWRLLVANTDYTFARIQFTDSEFAEVIQAALDESATTPPGAGEE